MSGIVLKGDWIKLHRNGRRVWVRERPFEVVWRTTADLTIDDILSIEIQSLRQELTRRRRMPVRQGTGRIVRPATTRVIIDHGDAEPLTVDVHETEAVVADAFSDLGDRLVIAHTIDLVAEHALEDQLAGDEFPRISWRADDHDAGDDVAPVEQEAPVAVATPDREELVATAQRVDPKLAEDVTFKLELGARPHEVEGWLQRQTATVDDPATDVDHHDLFPDAGDHDASSDEIDASGGWVRKRRKRPIHHRLRDSARR